MSDLQDTDARALGWLLEWALAQDYEASSHYWHISDGCADACGCKYENEG